MPSQLPVQSDPQGIEAYFTDSEKVLGDFKDFLSAPVLTRRLMVIYGVGGVGKTSLLRMFRQLCKGAQVPVALASSDEAKSEVDVLSLWADDLIAGDLKLPAFAKTLKRYRILQAKVEDQARKSQDERKKALGTIAKGIVKTAVEMAVPYIGPIASSVLSGMNPEALVDWLTSRGFSKTDLNLLLNPAEQLTTDFLVDLAKVASQKRVVLMLDAYELMLGLDDWVGELAQELQSNVLLVIAGRTLPLWKKWPDWIIQAHLEELKPMTEEVMRDLVQRYYSLLGAGELDPIQVEAIISFARGLPIVVTTAVKLWVQYGVQDFQAVRPRVVADLVDRLTEGLSPEMISFLEAASIMRWFDQSILRAVTGQTEVGKAYDELRQFPFIRSRREGLMVHDTVRGFIDDNLRVSDPERYHQLHERAANYFQTCLEKATGEEAERFALEWLYHRIRADEKNGIEDFQKMAETTARFNLVNRLRVILNDVRSSASGQESLAQWLKYFDARLLFLEKQIDKAEMIYQELHESALFLDPQLHARVLLGWGTILIKPERLYQPGGVENALSILNECEAILSNQDPDYPHLLIMKVLALLLQPDAVDKNIVVLNTAIALLREKRDLYGLSLAYGVLKAIYVGQGKWKELQEVERAGLEDLKSQPDSLLAKASFLAVWKVAWIWMGQYWEAERDLKEVIEVEIKSGRTEKKEEPPRDLLLAIGVQGRCREVDPYFHRSVELYRNLGTDFANDLAYFLGFWGTAAFQCGQLEQAEVRLNEAWDLSQKGKFSHSVFWSYGLGLCRLAQGNPDKADEDFQNCLRQVERPGLARPYFECGALVGLAWAHYKRRDYNRLPELILKAEQLIQLPEYNDHLASLQLLKSHGIWEGQIPNWGSGFHNALSHYQQALLYALRFNRFLLDEVLSGRQHGSPFLPIIPFCLRKGEEGQRMLTVLRDWWNTGVHTTETSRLGSISPIPERIQLQEAERRARKREPGDGSPQKTVSEQLEASITYSADSSDAKKIA